ncbi:MAG TPA: hypothetical protein VMM92_01850, partial [Thermoanaerobaculia bacterium]|nr:hypothetical protein [Thermoanaerobaculia bacterium]
MRQRVILLALSLAAAQGLAKAGEPAFRYERQILPGAAGPNRLEPDVALLARSQGSLADLRLFDAAGK